MGQRNILPPNIRHMTILLRESSVHAMHECDE